jgi:hypothetical protein
MFGMIFLEWKLISSHADKYGVLLNRSIVNEAAAASPVQPIVNMGQGFL